MTKIISFAIPLLILAGLPAWAGTDTTQTGEAVSVVDQNDAGKQSGETTADKKKELTGMDIPVDGSSLEAFNKSLEKIRENATDSQYTTLKNAIQYLLLYDLGIRSDRTKLAAKLDGMTGHEIVDKIKWRNIQK